MSVHLYDVPKMKQPYEHSLHQGPCAAIQYSHPQDQIRNTNCIRVLFIKQILTVSMTTVKLF